MKRSIIKYIVIIQLLIIAVVAIVVGCIGEQFTTQQKESTTTSASTTSSTGANVSTGADIRSDDYLQCCVLEHSCMLQLESNNFEPDASSGRVPIQDRALLTE